MWEKSITYFTLPAKKKKECFLSHDYDITKEGQKYSVYHTEVREDQCTTEQKKNSKLNKSLREPHLALGVMVKRGSPLHK